MGLHLSGSRLALSVSLSLSFLWAFMRPALPSPPAVSYPLLEPGLNARPLHLVMQGALPLQSQASKADCTPGTEELSWPMHLCALVRAREWE